MYSIPPTQPTLAAYTLSTFVVPDLVWVWLTVEPLQITCTHSSSLGSPPVTSPQLQSHSLSKFTERHVNVDEVIIGTRAAPRTRQTTMAFGTAPYGTYRDQRSGSGRTIKRTTDHGSRISKPQLGRSFDNFPPPSPHNQKTCKMITKEAENPHLVPI